MKSLMPVTRQKSLPMRDKLLLYYLCGIDLVYSWCLCKNAYVKMVCKYQSTLSHAETLLFTDSSKANVCNTTVCNCYKSSLN